MKFDLTPSQYQFISEVVVDPLRKNGNKVFCFGSRARGDHKPFSDLDLMIEGPLEARLLLSQMMEVLSQSHFPYKVDLVRLDEMAPSYLESYQRDRQEW